MDDISKNSLFLPEGMTIDFENTKCPSHVKAVKWTRGQRFVIMFFWLQEY
jgi:hypothetical protein